MQARKKRDIHCTLMLAVVVIMASGCGGEFSYKRGAEMADFQQQRDGCAAQKNTEYEIEQCLEKSGWVVVGIDKPLVAEQENTLITAEGRVVTVDHEPIEITTNSLEKLHISSWWKAGAGPDNLFIDGDNCAVELGEQYRGEANMSIVTMGLLGCMKDKRWFALEVK